MEEALNNQSPSQDMLNAAGILEDCLVAGDNAEQALADISSDYGVDAAELARVFEKTYGKSYLNYQ